jgi:hypothetical protein
VRCCSRGVGTAEWRSSLAGRTAGNHFRFGVWDNALAAADFAALLAFGLLSTLLAAFAALALVCFVFLGISHLLHAST